MRPRPARRNNRPRSRGGPLGAEDPLGRTGLGTVRRRDHSAALGPQRALRARGWRRDRGRRRCLQSIPQGEARARPAAMACRSGWRRGGARRAVAVPPHQVPRRRRSPQETACAFGGYSRAGRFETLGRGRHFGPVLAVLGMARIRFPSPLTVLADRSPRPHPYTSAARFVGALSASGRDGAPAGRHGAWRALPPLRAVGRASVVLPGDVPPSCPVGVPETVARVGRRAPTRSEALGCAGCSPPCGLGRGSRGRRLGRLLRAGHGFASAPPGSGEALGISPTVPLLPDGAAEPRKVRRRDGCLGSSPFGRLRPDFRPGSRGAER
jgi:hypothetical protein